MQFMFFIYKHYKKFIVILIIITILVINLTSVEEHLYIIMPKELDEVLYIKNDLQMICFYGSDSEKQALKTALEAIESYKYKSILQEFKEVFFLWMFLWISVLFNIMTIITIIGHPINLHLLYTIHTIDISLIPIVWDYYCAQIALEKVAMAA